MDVIEAIRARHTIRRFEKRAVEREKLETLLDAAVRAPNHRLTEPWRFHVLTGAALERFGEDMAAPLRARGEGEEVVAKFKADLLPAPAAVVVTCRTPESERQAREDYAATCAAIQNMLLAAVGLGLGGYWRTGRLVGDGQVRHSLGIPPEEEVVGVVCFGYPAETGGSRRTPWSEKTVWK